jgi:single-strand DNA-binding protein
MALNKILLIGHVGKDPEIHYLATPDHPKVAQFTLATTERMKPSGGAVRELTEWHNILAWRALADIVEKYVKKGMQVYIEGKVRTRSWESNGQKCFRTEVIAEKLQLLGSRQDMAQNAQPVQQQPQPAGFGNLFYPQQTQAMPTAQEVIYEQPKDDLPF